MDGLTVSVVIATWMRAGYLERCLGALRAQTSPPDEILVVGRRIDEEAHALVARAAQEPPLRWLEVEVPGHIPPIRRGLEEASGEIVAFLDDDAEPEPDWLERLMDPLRDPRVACAGGRFLGPGEEVGASVSRVKDAGRIRWYGAYKGNLGDLPGVAVSACDGVIEGACAWRKSVLAAVAFEPVFERGDSLLYGLSLCLQARERGYEVVYVPGARACHHRAPRRGVPERDDRVVRAQLLGRNLTYIWLRHYRGLRRIAFPFWWYLVGERHCYGVAKALVDLFLKGPTIWPAVRAGMRGRAEGFREWSAARRAGSLP